MELAILFSLIAADNVHPRAVRAETMGSELRDEMVHFSARNSPLQRDLDAFGSFAIEHMR